MSKYLLFKQQYRSKPQTVLVETDYVFKKGMFKIKKVLWHDYGYVLEGNGILFDGIEILEEYNELPKEFLI